MGKLIICGGLLLLVMTVTSCTSSLFHQEPETKKTWDDGIQISLEKRSAALDDYYLLWAGTHYRGGGNDENGLDCSAFVQLVYKELFDISLPRTTRALAHQGKEVTPARIKPTDLVFFKTGFFTRHVGIYRGNGQFIHVSTKKGVTRSSLYDGYWSEHFWQVRRIID